MHVPFLDPRAFELALKITEAWQPNTVVIGSDGLDCYKLSKFDKNPERRETIQDEIDEWVKRTREIKQAVPQAELVWIPGNHEDRLRRLVWANPGLYGLRVLTWPSLLSFEDLEITEAKYKEYVIKDRIVVKHGSAIRQHASRSGWVELNREAFAVTTISAHCHRMGMAPKTTRRGIVACYESGCLCNLNPEYASSVDWQQGIVLIEMSQTSHLFHIYPVMFIPSEGKLRVLWQGKEYIA
jgi:hypothetical protein